MPQPDPATGVSLVMNDATLLGLKPRALEIFNALVTASRIGQPIGSKTLAQRLRLTCRRRRFAAI